MRPPMLACLVPARDVPMGCCAWQLGWYMVGGRADEGSAWFEGCAGAAWPTVFDACRLFDCVTSSHGPDGLVWLRMGMQDLVRQRRSL